MNSPAGTAERDHARAPVRVWPLAAAATLALLLGGCGQKGPLYLPNAQKARVVPTPGAATSSGAPAEPTPPAANPANPGGTAGTPDSQTPQQRQPQPQSQSSQPGDSQPAAGASPSAGDSPAA